MSMQTSTYQQETLYYPYGGLMGESTSGDVQRYKYNGDWNPFRTLTKYGILTVIGDDKIPSR